MGDQLGHRLADAPPQRPRPRPAHRRAPHRARARPATRHAHRVGGHYLRAIRVRAGRAPGKHHHHHRRRTAGPGSPDGHGAAALRLPESLRHDAPAIFDAARRRGAGDVDRRDSLWDQILGLTTPALAEPSEAAAPTPTTAATPTRQTVRFDDPTGRPKGFAVYSVTLEGDAYPGRLDVVDLVAATDAAYTALWRFLLDLDLIGEVSAPLRSTAEPLVWQLENPRAVRASAERDHLWLRLLDVPAALEHRRYAAPGVFLLDVSDDLGIAGGEFLLTVSPDGAGSAHPLAAGEATPAGAAHLSLSVAALSALYLGGPSAVVLSRAGRVTEHTEDAATQVDAAFRSGQPPHLSTWF
ncbi:sterol carrier protein domain-containing protein [Cryobacterium sp. 10C3]|uniref:sterol carrier protein domain-containing protein n=1 Tax=Cryobacterium sp. 10C3 TaxID=3048577 RepID=UPI003A0FE572